ncbi:glycosyl transferase family 2 [Pseudomonas oryzihabitans]|uniref:glycosyltransferase n=1 Tax=Pseudomonas oryzihabitans TaxID=47885 RepID=UPI00165E7521|nr:glycosyltransferase [Pseudomonas psychrotolerans]QNQ99917.1 glycosyl transferase family 2 [Pseudomonas psychrotolerans]
MAEWIFWASVAVPLYAYLGYPLAITCGGWLTPRRPRLVAPPLSVSVVIAAHNEARHIEAKLASLLSQTYHPTALDILVASDGSTDTTVSLARAFASDQVRVLDLPRIGKAAALNAAVAESRGEILVFTDADNRWAPTTLAELLGPLADPQVGACGGNLRILETGTGLSLGDSLYRRYEAWLRQAEDRLGCTVAADGALLALRHELFSPIPGEVNDDFFLSTCAPLAQRRIAYVDSARVLDQGVDAPQHQFRRRLRVTIGGLQSLAQRKALLNPFRYGRYALALLSHKLLRRLAPLALLPLLASNLLLLATPCYQLTLAAQLLAYGSALLGLLDRQGRLPRPFRLAAFLLVTLAGMAVGLVQFLAGRRHTLWNPEQNR